MRLDATKREKLGKKNRSLRRENMLPVVVFGKGMESVSLQLPYIQFVKLFEEAGETNIVDLVVGDTEYKVLIKDLQFHPVSGNVIHASFQRVNLKEKITVEIPVEIVNEEENPLVKSGEAIALLVINTIPVEALPMNLPNSFDVDISALKEIGDHITIADLNYDREKVEIQDFEAEDVVAKLDYAVQEEQETSATEEELLEKLQVLQEKEDVSDEEGSSEDAE